MSDTKTPAPEQSSFELIDAPELGRRLHVPTSWIRSRTSPSTPRDKRIPFLKFGRYTRFRWNSPELVEWLRRQQQ